MTDGQPIAALRECMMLVQTGMNAIMGIDRGRRGELSPITAGILYLSSVQKTRMGDVARVFEVSGSTATGYIDSLERQGYVRREQGEEDRRDIYIVPAPRGERWIMETEARVFAMADVWLGRLHPTQRLQFIEWFSKFTGYDEERGPETAVADLMKRAPSGNKEDRPFGPVETRVRSSSAWDSGIWYEE